MKVVIVFKSKKNTKKVVLFMTCASGLDQSEKLKETIRNQGLSLEERTFCSKGHAFLFANRNTQYYRFTAGSEICNKYN